MTFYTLHIWYLIDSAAFQEGPITYDLVTYRDHLPLDIFGGWHLSISPSFELDNRLDQLEELFLSVFSRFVQFWKFIFIQKSEFDIFWCRW